MYTEKDVIYTDGDGGFVIGVEFTFVDPSGEQYCYELDVAVTFDYDDYNMRTGEVHGLRVYGTGVILDGVDLTRLANHCDLERIEEDILDSNS